MIIGISGKKNSGKDMVGEMIKNITSFDYDPFRDEKELHSKWETIQFADTIKEMTCAFFGCTRRELENRLYKERIVDIGGIEITPRRFMQLLGTELGRDLIHPELWSKRTLMDYKVRHDDYTFGMYFKRCMNCDTKMSFVGKSQLFCKSCCKIGVEPSWIITDVRFPEEVEAIKKLGGVVWRIERKGIKEAEVSVRARKRFFKGLEENGLEPVPFKLITLNDEFSKIYEEEWENYEEHYSETALDNYGKFDEIITNDSTIKDVESQVLGLLLLGDYI